MRIKWSFSTETNLPRSNASYVCSNARVADKIDFVQLIEEVEKKSVVLLIANQIQIKCDQSKCVPILLQLLSRNGKKFSDFSLPARNVVGDKKSKHFFICGTQHWSTLAEATHPFRFLFQHFLAENVRIKIMELRRSENFAYNALHAHKFRALSASTLNHEYTVK